MDTASTGKTTSRLARRGSVGLRPEMSMDAESGAVKGPRSFPETALTPLRGGPRTLLRAPVRTGSMQPTPGQASDAVEATRSAAGALARRRGVA
jgi:hypothetical protein